MEDKRIDEAVSRAVSEYGGVFKRLGEEDKTKCQVCGKPKDECEDWNAYYQACEACL